MKKDKNFVLISDLYGTVLDRIPNNEIDFIIIGENILKIVAKDSQNKFFNFIKEIKEQGYIMGYKINLIINGKVAAYYLHGFIKEKKINITFYVDEDDTTDILAEIIKLNNMQINELRKKYKEQALEKAKIEEDVYSELTKLNNELLNSKRIIEKQNAQLSEYNLLLEDLAMKDSLTGAYNRRYFYDKIPGLANKTYQQKGKMFFALLDLNYFKKLNDLHGHDFGDKMLKTLVSLAKENKSTEDLVFRIGGDEFLIVFINSTKEKILDIMERIESGYKKATDISTVSYGLLEINLTEKIMDQSIIDSYIKEADRLMYEHKAKVKSYD